jgi:hypothetical protein
VRLSYIHALVMGTSADFFLNLDSIKFHTLGVPVSYVLFLAFDALAGASSKAPSRVVSAATHLQAPTDTRIRRLRFGKLERLRETLLQTFVQLFLCAITSQAQKRNLKTQERRTDDTAAVLVRISVI